MSGQFTKLVCSGRLFHRLRVNSHLATCIGRMHPSKGLSVALRGRKRSTIVSFSRVLLRRLRRGNKHAPFYSGDPTRRVCTMFKIDGGIFGGTINSLCGGELVIVARRNLRLT